MQLYLASLLLLGLSHPIYGADTRSLRANASSAARQEQRLFDQCQGDCDDHSDCRAGFICLQRGNYNDYGGFIPGCSSINPPNKHRDYCVRERDLPDKTLYFIAEHDDPDYRYKFLECHGHCESDSDCEGDLTCYNPRGSNVPGCNGKADSGVNYCIDRKNAEGHLDECQGDCNDHSDCKDGLVCLKQEYNSYDTIPGCFFISSRGNLDNVCVDPKNFYAGQLVFLGNNNSPAFPYPLGECQGDCDSDRDCAGSLKCHKGSGSPPGCFGDHQRGYHYCYRDPDELTRLDFVGPDEKNLGQCQGDCDKDSDCRGDLVCFHRNTDNAHHSVPGCFGAAYHDDTDYCIHPRDVSTYENSELISWGLKHGDWPAALYPFGKCQGDCDTDDDCAGFLKCSKTYDGSPIAGCRGHIGREFEYCYDPFDVV